MVIRVHPSMGRQDQGQPWQDFWIGPGGGEGAVRRSLPDEISGGPGVVPSSMPTQWKRRRPTFGKRIMNDPPRRGHFSLGGRGAHGLGRYLRPGLWLGDPSRDCFKRWRPPPAL